MPNVDDLGFDIAPLAAEIEFWELQKLPGLSPLAQALFIWLVATSDRKTGRMTTSYYRLTQLLTADEGPGPKAGKAPSLQNVRTALQSLIDRRLAAKANQYNMGRGVLEILIRPRKNPKFAPEQSNRGSNRPLKPAEVRYKRGTQKPTAQSNRESNSSSLLASQTLKKPTVIDQGLSTAPGQSEAAKAGRQKARAMLAQAKSTPPRGARRPPALKPGDVPY